MSIGNKVGNVTDRAGKGKTGNGRGVRTARVLAPVALAALASAGLFPGNAHGQTNGIWSNNATSGGLWSTTTNWVNGNVASGVGAIATFNTPGVANTVHLNAPYTVGTVNFNNSSATLSWTIDNNNVSTNVLTLATSVGVPTITTTTSGATSIITAGLAGTQGFNYTGAGNLQLNSSSSTISGPVNVVAALAGGTYLQDYSTSTLANTTSLYMTSGTSGTSGMQVLGGVTIPSTAPATFNMNSGGRIDFDSVGSGTATFNNSIGFTNGASTQITELQMEGSNMTFNGNVTVTNYANANFQIRATAASGSGVGTFNGNLILPAGVTLLENQDGGFAFTYVLNGTGNSFTLFGGTYGTYKTGVNGALPAASVYSDATAAATTGVLDLFGTNQTITGLNEVSNGNYTIGSSSNTSNSVLTLNNSTGNIYNFRGIITNVVTTSGLTGTKTVGLGLQQGAQILSGADTYSGGTTVTGGTLISNNSSAFGTGFVTVTGPGTLNNNTGTYVTLNNLSLNGATITANTGINATSNGAFGLVGTVTVGGTAASSIASASGASNNYVQIGNTSTGSTTTFNVGLTGATGADLTVNVPIANYQSGAGYVTTANLTKTGAGTMQITGVNKYTGTTNISAGTLQLASGASISTSPLILIGSAGTFDTSLVGGYTTLSNQAIQGVGTIKGILTHSAGTITPAAANGSGGLLTFTNGLTLNGGSLQFNLTSTPSSSANSEISVTAANGLVNNASSTPLNITFSSLPSGSVVYPLFAYTGTLGGTFSNSTFALAANAGRDTFTIDTSTPGLVNLDVTATQATLVWNSATNNAWDVQTSKNWKNTTNPALTPDYFYQGDNVAFDDTVGVQTNVSINTAVQPSSLSVISNTNNFTFSGSGSISGPTGLTKTGSSYLTLETSNAYTGVTNISGGTLDVGGSTSSGTLGTGPVLNNATLVLSRSDGTSATPVTVANTITGTGVLNYTGAGTTSLTGQITQLAVIVNNSAGVLTLANVLNASSGVTVNAGTFISNVAYNGSGGLTINSGLAVIAGVNAFTGPVTINNGGLMYPESFTAFGLGTAPVTVNTGGGIYFLTLNGSFTQPFIVNGTGNNSAGAFHAGASTVTTLNGTVTAPTNSLFQVDGAATLVLANATALQSFNNSSVTLTGTGPVIINGNVNLGSGGIVNTLATATALEFNITTNPAINNYSTISGTGNVQVNGLNGSSGTVNFLVDSSYTGGTSIYSGILAISTPNGLGANGDAVYIAGGGSAVDELQLTGGITVNENFQLGGKQPVLPESIDPHIRSVSGNNTISGPITTAANGNEYNIQSDAGLLTISGGYTQTNGGTRFLNLEGAGNGLFTSAIGNSSGADAEVTKLGTGTWTLGVANTYGGPTNVTAGTLVFGAPGALPNFTGLMLTGGVAQAAAYTTGNAKNSLFVNSLSIAGTAGAYTGTVDLTNNDMIVQNGSIGTVTSYTAEGFNGGKWNGAGGILSSAAAANTKHLTALGVIENSVDGTTTGTTLDLTFDGQNSTSADVLVKYTYYGDTDLNGKVDGTDYSRIDAAFANNSNATITAANGFATGWFNGDFNYDGVVNGSDYTLMDNAFNQQGAQLSAQVASATALVGGGGSAVPEPATMGLLAIGAIGLLGRRNPRQR